MAQRPAALFEFGRFRVDVSERRLLADGIPAHLTPKAFDVLCVLLREHGRLVTKQQLMDRVWPNTFVGDAALTRCVADVRKVLGESGTERQYIDTVTKQGYRFVAAVREIDGAPQVSRSAANERQSRRWTLLAAVATAVTVVAWLAPQPDQAAAPRAMPLVPFAGVKRQPALSPDGKSVAFSWQVEDRGAHSDSDLYVQVVGGSEPRRLTTGEAFDHSPAWSPDGGSIAFLRGVGETTEAVMLVAANGGPVRQVAEIATTRRSYAANLTWSRNGQWLAFPDRSAGTGPSSLFLLSLDSGEKRRLTAPPAESSGDLAPAFSPTRNALIFSRGVLDTVADLYLLQLSNDLWPVGEPQRVTHFNGSIPTSAWAPDGRSVVFGAGPWGKTNLWRVDPFNGRKPARLAFVGEDGSSPSVSREGQRLAYAKASTNMNIWRVDTTRARAARGVATKFISSAGIEQTPSYSPDGTRIAFASNRSGRWQIWTCAADGSAASPVTTGGDEFSRYPRWSPDGRRIAFDSRQHGNAEVYVIDAKGGIPLRLTSDAASDTAPSWSADGRFIYFTSNRSGRNEIWKISVSGQTPRQVTASGGSNAMESADGRDLYYLRAEDLWKVPASGGEERRVVTGVSHYAVRANGIYFVGWSAPHSTYAVQFHDFETGTTRMLALTDKPAHTGFTVSPDGKIALFIQIDQTSSDLMLVERFQ